MSTNQQNKNNEEEVDLGSLFVIIGKGFKNFFNFIGSIFKGVFHFIITILIFLKTNALKIGVAAIAGFSLGFFLEFTSTPTYKSEMLVEPNFNSTKQLYNNINYFNDLILLKKENELEKIFGINSEDAKSLMAFMIEPEINENDVLSGYDRLLKSVDTLASKNYTFKNYKSTFTDFDYTYHRITVLSKKNDIFKNLGNVITSSLTKNEFFKRQKRFSNENLNRTDSLLRKNLVQVDSLRKVYMQVMLTEAKKESNGTTIDLGSKQTVTKEIDLFNENYKLNSSLEKVMLDKSKKYEIVNVISNFQPYGNKIGGLRRNKAFLLTLLFSGLTILLLLLIKLNKYLDSYKE